VVDLNPSPTRPSPAKLLPNPVDAKAAKTNVYGYLLATVSADHTIEFKFHEAAETETPAVVVAHFSADFIH
jgi:hypothetical protein